MLPLKTLRKPQSTPSATYTLIVINVLVFLWLIMQGQDKIISAYWQMGLVPCRITDNILTIHTVTDSITSMFLHGGWLHLVGNMFFLYLVGPLVEDYFGKTLFVIFYFLAGFGATFLHILFNSNVCIPAIGASGAISGVMGAFLILYPATRFSMLAVFFRIPVGVINVQAFYILLYFFVWDLIDGLGAIGHTATGGVAVWAHVGGFIAGFLIAFVAIMFKPAPEVDPFEYLDAD